MNYRQSFHIVKPDYGPFRGSYLIVTDDEQEIIEIFKDLASAERWLADNENGTDHGL